MLVSAPRYLRYQRLMTAVDVPRINQALVDVSLNRKSPLQASHQHVQFNMLAQQMLAAHQLG